MPPQRWLFVSDVDDTLLGDRHALIQLATTINANRSKLIIALNSSRPCASLHGSLSDGLLMLSPDYLIGALGTEVDVLNPAMPALTEMSNRWSTADWRWETVVAALNGLMHEMHEDTFQTPYKVSFDLLHGASPNLVMERLAAQGFAAKIIVTNNVKVDIIPPGAGKRSDIEALAHTLHVSLEFVVVAGDSENDLDMFVPPIKGIVVGNARPVLKALSGERVFVSAYSYAQGVLDDLRHWGIL